MQTYEVVFILLCFTQNAICMVFAPALSPISLAAGQKICSLLCCLVKHVFLPSSFSITLFHHIQTYLLYIGSVTTLIYLNCPKKQLGDDKYLYNRLANFISQNNHYQFFTLVEVSNKVTKWRTCNFVSVRFVTKHTVDLTVTFLD